MFIFNRARAKIYKRGRDTLGGVRKLIRINRDIMPAEGVAESRRLCDELAMVLKAKDDARVISLCEKLEKQVDRSLPSHSRPGLRENIEVLVVAVIVAMGVRTFFVQPFKIPTGSMQPTLYGIYPSMGPPHPYENSWPNGLQRLIGTVLWGRIHEPTGYRTRGDHIFVNKMIYHFAQPKRGEVIVFETKHIGLMRPESRGKFFIKRLAGIGGDKLDIRPPHLYVNGEVLDSRPAFERIYSMKNGYNGYQNMNGHPWRFLRRPGDVFTVPDNELFALGDNTMSSSDSREWGAFQRRELVGRAFFVYWPLSKRFGRIE